MSGIAIVVPTIGRSSLQETLFSLVPQVGGEDRVMVVCDRMAEHGPFDYVSACVEQARRAAPNATWRCYPGGDEGVYGHAARNRMLDLLIELDDAPKWVWSIDDDDEATFGALDMIRADIVSSRGPWYVFQMRGGAGSTFNGVTIPTQGSRIAIGNLGTPCIVAPVCAARWGTSDMSGSGPGFHTELAPGYFGDYEIAVALQAELGDPVWVPQTVCVVRPKESE